MEQTTGMSGKELLNVVGPVNFSMAVSNAVTEVTLKSAEALPFES